jgi:hypothetical protein
MDELWILISLAIMVIILGIARDWYRSRVEWQGLDIPNVEFGLRKDGVIVWRKRKI